MKSSNSESTVFVLFQLVLVSTEEVTYQTSLLSPQISSEFRQLRPVFQEVIADIAKRMGSGMTVFLQEKVGSMAEWDEVGASIMETVTL